MGTSAQGYITDLPYTDNYYEQLAPVTLNYLAAVNGCRPRDLSDFDYCEVGCGFGLSLLVHAAAHPAGRFVGIDLNAAHIRHAEVRATEAGIANVRLIAEPVGEIPGSTDLPRFDFIVLHGVYSYVGEAVRGEILRFIDRHLKPGGLVLVSYNALPGYAGHQAVGEIMRRFARPLSDNSLERAELGLSCLRLMLNAQVPFFRLNPELAKYAESLFDRDPRYIAHEFFHEHWNPFSVDQVSGEMDTVGLEFAGALPLWQNHPEADVPEILAPFFATQPERLSREAHKDFIYNTVFRTDLYIRPEPADAHRVERTAALWNMPFCGVTPPESVRLSVHSGALTLPLNSRESRIVFNLLQGRPRTPAQLSAHPVLQAIEPARLIDMICWWVLSAQVRPALPADDDAADNSAAEINTAMAVDALREGVLGKAWLVSRRLGIAFQFDRLPALALCAASTSPEASPEARLCTLIARCGLSMEENDAPIPHTELQGLAAQLYAELAAGGTLAQAQRLGIVA